MVMIETVKGVVMIIGCVLAKILMGVLNVAVCITVIFIAVFVVVLIKSINDGVFRDEDDDDDIDYLDDDYCDEDEDIWEYGKNENKN